MRKGSRKYKGYRRDLMRPRLCSTERYQQSCRQFALIESGLPEQDRVIHLSKLTMWRRSAQVIRLSIELVVLIQFETCDSQEILRQWTNNL